MIDRPSICSDFNQAGRTEALKSGESGGQLKTAQMIRRADTIRERHIVHYEKHRQLFVNREYGKLLSKQGIDHEYVPPGMSSNLRAKAAANVQHRFEQRHQRIDKAERTVLKTNMRQVHQNRVQELRLGQDEKLRGAQERLKKSRER